MATEFTPIPQLSEVIAFIVRNFSHVDDARDYALKKSLQRLRDDTPLSVDAAMELIDTHLARFRNANSNDDLWHHELRFGLQAYVRLSMNLDCAAIPAVAIRKVFDRVAAGIFCELFDVALKGIGVRSDEILKQPDYAITRLWQARLRDRKLLELAAELETTRGLHRGEDNWEKRLRDWTTPGKGMQIEAILRLMENWDRYFARALLLARAYQNYCKFSFIDPAYHAKKYLLPQDANRIQQKIVSLFEGQYSDECFLHPELQLLANDLTKLTDPQRPKAIGDAAQVETILGRFDNTLAGEPRLAGLGCLSGRYLAQMGRYKEALAAYEMAATWFLFRSSAQFKVSLHHLLILAAALQDKRCLKKWTKVSESIGLGVHIPSPNLAIARDYPHPFPESCAKSVPTDPLKAHYVIPEDWERRSADLGGPNRVVKGYGQTPTPQLGLFANLGQPEKVQALLEAGADPNKLDHSGGSALLMALQGKNAQCVRQLIVVSALKTINQQTRQGHTPLHEAVRQCRPDWVEALIEKGADVTLAGRQGWPPLLVATSCFEEPSLTFSRILDPDYVARHIERVPVPLLPNTPFILDQAEVLVSEISSDPELFITIAASLKCPPTNSECSRRIVRLLLEVGADPNQRTEQEQLTPFLYATEIGDPWLLNILIENGANIRARDEFGAAAYARLNRFGHQQLASDLLQRVCPHDRLWLREQAQAYVS